MAFSTWSEVLQSMKDIIAGVNPTVKSVTLPSGESINYQTDPDVFLKWFKFAERMAAQESGSGSRILYAKNGGRH